MRSGKWIMCLLSIMSILASASPSWADPQHKHRNDGAGCEEQWDKHQKGRPPGWDKGKKTGWQGQDVPPGQQKKAYRYHQDQDRPEVIPVPVPVPVPR